LHLSISGGKNMAIPPFRRLKPTTPSSIGSLIISLLAMAIASKLVVFKAIFSHFLGIWAIVCSFGFIEHFIEWEVVVTRHLELVAPEGLLIIMSPNFAGAWQKHFHRLFDKQNFLRYYLPAMEPFKWRAIAEKAGFTTNFCGYFGRFDFGAAYQQHSFFAKLMVHGMVDILVPLLRRLPWPEGQQLYTPCCVFIAQKKGKELNHRGG
jgi:hypothetical protein